MPILFPYAPNRGFFVFAPRAEEIRCAIPATLDILLAQKAILGYQHPFTKTTFHG
jgi:hypothetical protein